MALRHSPFPGRIEAHQCKILWGTRFLSTLKRFPYLFSNRSIVGATSWSLHDKEVEVLTESIAFHDNRTS